MKEAWNEQAIYHIFEGPAAISRFWELSNVDVISIFAWIRHSREEEEGPAIELMQENRV